MALALVKAPSDGMNTAAAPDYVPPTQAPLLTNMLPGRPGMAYLRGPIKQSFSDASFATKTFNNQFIWSSGDKIALSSDSITPSSYWLDALGTGLLTPTAFAPSTFISSPQHARVGAYVYGGVGTPAGGTATLGKWDPAGNTIATRTNSPFNWIDVKAHLNRLWVLGGSVPGTTTPIKSNVLYWTDPTTAPDGPSADTLAEWKDSVSGLVNQIVVSALDSPVALARCGQYLAILMRRSIYLLTGSGSSSFAIRLVSSEFGCASLGTSIVEVSDGFYFQSDSGYCFCDGVTVRNVSLDIQPTSVKYASSANGAAVLPSGHIFLSYGASGLSWLFNPASGAWTRFDPRASWAFRTSSYVWAYTSAATTIVNIAGVAQRDDTDPLYDVFTFGGKTAITARANLRLISPSGPMSLSQMQMLFMDSRLVMTTPGTAAGPVVSFSNSAGASLGTPATLTPSNAAAKRRSAIDLSGIETSDIAVSVAWTTDPVNGPSMAGAFELYDSALEFQPAQQRGTI